MKALGSGFLFLTGLFVITFIFMFGAVKVSEFLYPIITPLAGLSIMIFALVLLPLSYFEKLREHIAMISIALSLVVGAAVFVFSFLVVVNYFGWFGFIFILLLQVISPIAALWLFFSGEWANGFYILIGLVFAYGMRVYGLWLAAMVDAVAYEREMAAMGAAAGEVIDLDS